MLAESRGQNQIARVILNDPLGTADALAELACVEDVLHVPQYVPIGTRSADNAPIALA